MKLRRIKELATIAAVGILGLSLASCGSDGNPLASAEEMVSEHAGANTPITTANVEEVSEYAVSEIGDAFEQIQQQAYSTKQSKEATTYSVELDDIVIQGQYSGTLKLTSGKLNVTSDTSGNTTISMNMKVEFNDFSNDGEIFLGGTYEATYSMESDLYGEMSELTATVKAYIAMAGAYSGVFKIDVTATSSFSNNDFTVTVTGTATVNGESVNLTITDM